MPTKPSQSIAFSRVSASAALDLAVLRTASVPKFSPGWSCTAIITFCRHDSRLNSRTSWNERTMPLRATRFGVEPDQLLAVQQDRARVGRDGAGEQVEHRRLAGAVGADEGGDRALAQLDGELVGGDDAAEALATRSTSARTTGRLVPRPLAAVLLGDRQLGVDVLGDVAARSAGTQSSTISTRAFGAALAAEPSPQREALGQRALRPHPHQDDERRCRRR